MRVYGTLNPMSDPSIPQQTITMEDSGLPPASAYFLSLTLENIRCFATRQTLDLSDGNGKPCMWNVLLGENGTGKTSLLIALASSIPYEKYVYPDRIRVGMPEVSNISQYRTKNTGNFSRLKGIASA